jgi:hypothetical protein
MFIGCGGRNLDKKTHLDVIKGNVWFTNLEMLDK